MVKKFSYGKYILTIIAYGFFIVEILTIYAHINVCAFEHNVNELKNISLNYALGEYLYEIENSIIDEEDLYRLVNISGWLIKKDNDKYMPVNADLLLLSESNLYKVKIYSEKRTDLHCLNQSNPNSKDLYVGWFGKFPATTLETGKYKIGFILYDGVEQTILMTNKIIEIL